MLEDEIKKNIKKNINKCARCALCVQNCPIYKIKKDENNTARGLICKLSGFEKGILSDSDIKHDLKICLNCSKCKSNCPSKVDTSLIFSYKNACLSPSKLSQRVLLALKLMSIKILYFFNFFKRIKKSKVKSDILYFKGCIAKAQHKTTFLDNLFYNPNFSCCGLPYFTGGDLKNYNKAKAKNIELISEAKTVIFDCASCKSSVSEYYELSKEDKDKLMFFSEFLKEKQLTLKENSKFKNKKITFHKPCHMTNDDFNNIETLLKSIKGVNYVKLDEIDSCCGFGGSYFMYHPVVSTKIALKKAETIKLSNADLILTACPACVMGLRFNQIISFNFKKTLELRDFIENEIMVV